MRLDGGVAEPPVADLAIEKVFHLVGVVGIKDPPGDFAGIERLVGAGHRMRAEPAAADRADQRPPALICP